MTREELINVPPTLDGYEQAAVQAVMRKGHTDPYKICCAAVRVTFLALNARQNVYGDLDAVVKACGTPFLQPETKPVQPLHHHHAPE